MIIEKDRALSGQTNSLIYPDYSQTHLTPVSMSISSNDLSFNLCALNFEEYSQAPHIMPMFKDVVSASRCRHNYKSLSALKEEIKSASDTPAGRVLYPSGFVFHESRVGSTLVANVLGSDPMNMIFSESQPPADAFLRCSGCTHERHVEVFRDTILMMGRSPVHKRLFFKFQSITSTKMQIALEVSKSDPNTQSSHHLAMVSIGTIACLQ
jgi:hypothetical protein